MISAAIKKHNNQFIKTKKTSYQITNYVVCFSYIRKYLEVGSVKYYFFLFTR